jgi:argininosuccinate synthase
VDGGPAIWEGFVKPFVWAGEGYQGQYPLLVSDRYLIVDAALKRADELGTRAIAHGCTGMGNDQVRFDLTVKALGDYEIVAPIREIQKEHTAVRAYEQTYLEDRGFGVRAKQQAYTINAVAVESKHILNAKGATYAQTADWGVAEAEGFIKLFGMSSTLWAEVNRS